MKWNGRNYRPVVPKKIQVKEEFNVEELLESLAEKHYKIPVWRSVVGVNVPPTAGPPISPSPTPFVTPTMTPSPSPPAFNPSTFGDLQVWFDASDASTLTTVTEGSDTYVTEWDSKGILNYPISAETTNRRPLYITNGGDGTKPAVYFQNTGNTREVLFNRGTLNMETTSGFTMFWVGRYAGPTPLTGIIQTSPGPINMWNSNYTNINSAEGITWNYRTLTDRQPITSGSTTVYSNTYEVNYNQNRALLNHSRYALMGMSYDYTQNIPTVQPISTTIWGGNLYKSSSASSGYTSNFSTQGKNLNSFGMMGYKLSTTYIQSSTLNQPWEMFEVLVYNKPLTQNQFNQVESYLNNKWNLTGSSSNEAILNIDWNPGLEFTGTNFQNLVITGSTQQSLQWAGTWKNTNDVLPLSANTQWYFMTERPGVNPPKFDFGLYDSSNNFITGATCFDATTLANAIPFNLSAGTYTLTGQARYDCVSPTMTPTMSPTTTPTPSITPQPTVTPTQTTTQTPSSTPPSPDSGATAYLNAVVTAGGTVDATMSAATNTFFTTIRNAGILDKIFTMYPFIGGTAASHRINAITPTGSNGTFNGGWTHNVSGCTPNGVNAWLAPKQGSANADVLPGNYTGFSHGVYVNEVLGTGNIGVAAGVYDAVVDLAQIGFSTTNETAIASNTSFATILGITRDTNGGFYGGTRINSSQEIQQQNSSGFTASTTYAPVDTAKGYVLGARFSNNTINEFFTKRLSFAFMGQNLTGSDLSTLNTAVQTYQTSLSRQV